MRTLGNLKLDGSPLMPFRMCLTRIFQKSNSIKKCWFLRLRQYLSSRFLHYSLTVFWASLRVLDFSACSPEVRTLGNFLGTRETCKNLELKYCPNLKNQHFLMQLSSSSALSASRFRKKISHGQLSITNCETGVFKVPESSHWEPFICSAESLDFAKVPRDLKSSPKGSPKGSPETFS